jgi:hypothetical protein
MPPAVATLIMILYGRVTICDLHALDLHLHDSVQSQSVMVSIILDQ